MEEDGSQSSRKKSLESLSHLTSNEVNSAAKRVRQSTGVWVYNMDGTFLCGL